MNSDENRRRQQQRDLAALLAKMEREASIPPEKPKPKLDIPHASELPPLPPPFIEEVDLEAETVPQLVQQSVPFIINTSSANPYSYSATASVRSACSESQVVPKHRKSKQNWIVILLGVIACSCVALACIGIYIATKPTPYDQFKADLQKASEQAQIVADKLKRQNDWNEQILRRREEMYKQGRSHEEIKAFLEKHLNNPPTEFQSRPKQ